MTQQKDKNLICLIYRTGLTELTSDYYESLHLNATAFTSFYQTETDVEVIVSLLKWELASC